ncbi:WhiB family transcriptional regulator [Microbacterium deminutum]
MASFTDDATKPSEVAHICSRCPIKVECLAYARAARPAAGVWAGATWGGRESSHVAQRLDDAARIIAQDPEGVSITEVARRLDLHEGAARTVVQTLVRTGRATVVKRHRAPWTYRAVAA